MSLIAIDGQSLHKFTEVILDVINVWKCRLTISKCFRPMCTGFGRYRIEYVIKKYFFLKLDDSSGPLWNGKLLDCTVFASVRSGNSL